MWCLYPAIDLYSFTYTIKTFASIMHVYDLYMLKIMIHHNIIRFQFEFDAISFEHQINQQTQNKIYK